MSIDYILFRVCDEHTAEEKAELLALIKAQREVIDVNRDAINGRRVELLIMPGTDDAIASLDEVTAALDLMDERLDVAESIIDPFEPTSMEQVPGRLH